MKFKEIVACATDVKKYVEKNHKLPIKSKGIGKAAYEYILIKSVMNIGKDTIQVLSFKEAPAPNGDSISKTLTKKEYQTIASDVNKFINKNKRLPNYVTFQNKKININLVTYCMAKIIVFYAKNNRLPNTCEFKSRVFKSNSSSSNTNHTTKGGFVCKKLVNIAKKSINNYKDVYNAMMKFNYNYYTDDVKPQSKTLSDKTGNCVDLNQIAYYALKELGYTVQIVRGTIKCDKTYGHVWCRIKINGKWVNFDASAAAKGKSLGTMICGTITSITNINPSWAVSDDGRT